MVDRVWADVGSADIELRVVALAPAVGDAAMLSRVWTNLLSNAVKFSRGQSQPRIEISSAVAGGEVVYTVTDNGIGFDPLG